MSIFTHAVCVVVGEFNREADRTFYRVAQVLQVFKSQEEADEAFEIFYPGRYDESGDVRVVPVEDLDESFR